MLRIAIVLLLLGGVAHADDTDDVDEAAVDEAGCAPAEAAPVTGPAVHAVVAHALATAGYDASPAHGWRMRARLAALVPYVGVRAGRNTRWEAVDPTVGYGTAYEVRATWRLDRLVFDGRELQIASVEAARRRERGRLASRVIRLYYAWRRAVQRAGPCALVAEQAAAELDALTDDWFTTTSAYPP